MVKTTQEGDKEPYGYIAYLKDNSQGHWFRLKFFGWGWVPVKWQGWLVLFLYLAFISVIILTREEYIPGVPDSGSNMLTFALPIFILTVLLIAIAYKKGEKPRWRWGLLRGAK
jgi:hypothetical protein